MKRCDILLAVFACALLVFSASVQAELIQIGLTAQVGYVDDPYNLLGNNVHQGDTITGFYTYDSLASDLSPDSTVWGSYQFSTSPYGISLTVGGLIFQTDPTNVNFVITIADNYDGSDFYGADSLNNLPLNNDVQIQDLRLGLWNDWGNAFTSDALVPLDSDVSKWTNGDLQLIISGRKEPMPPGEKTEFYIDGHLTSVYVIIPEPTSLCLLALGGLFLRRKF